MRNAVSPLRARLADPEVLAIPLVLVAVFAFQVWLGDGDEAFIDHWGASPIRLARALEALRRTGLSPAIARALAPLVTANFLHQNLRHLGSNLLFYWIFANALVTVSGRRLFLPIYLLSGVAAAAGYAFAEAGSRSVMLGASGADAGLAGAYFMFALHGDPPDVHVWPLSGPVTSMQLAVAAALNFAFDSGALLGGARDHIAYGAHVGGFCGGALLGLTIATLRPRKPRARNPI